MSGHTVQFSRHGGGYAAFVNGRRVGFVRRELRNHPRRSAGSGTPSSWNCWRLYRHGIPYTTGATRRDAAVRAWNRMQAAAGRHAKRMESRV